MKRQTSVWLGLLLLVGACAHKPEPAATAAGPDARQSEIQELERRIADKKAALGGGESRSIAEAPAPTPMASGDAPGLAPGGRCDGVCAAAEDICTCQRRICRLAADIGDEKSAESCRRAGRECEEAGRLCAACR